MVDFKDPPVTDEEDMDNNFAWWLCMLPGAAIMLTVMSVNLLGDALADRINPALRGRDH